ncbi:MAG: class I SAM-dependent methyltransferase [Gammaproteobacteria bacterium]|jgi:cyclopropane fatty-acyl-phospholipid synthase-like methyltransferase|nr:class I SAM-dependent methyltransferase [Gammaproteobacteria bacterium]
MGIFDYYTIADRDHAWQNPTSAAKLDLLIDYCGFSNGDRVLDVGCGKGWLLQRIAERRCQRGRHRFVHRLGSAMFVGKDRSR